MYGLKEDCFLALVRKTRSGHRRLRRFLRQTALAGLENPRSLRYAG